MPETIVYSCDMDDCGSKRGAKPYVISVNGEARQVILCSTHGAGMVEVLRASRPAAKAAPQTTTEDDFTSMHRPRPPGQ